MVFDAVARHTGGLLTLEHFPELGGGDYSVLDASAQPESGKGVDEAIYALFGRFPTLKEVEDYLISSAMKLTKGNQRSAAIMLGIARQTLSKRLVNSSAGQGGKD